jgi:N-acetyl-anhydromuramyl-L-alanine amidase AmpD
MGDGWCPFATKIIVSNNFDKGRSGQIVNAVVLHIADGQLAGVFPTFNDPTSLKSAHFCIGKNGEIEQYVSINDTAYGNGLRWQNGLWFNQRGIQVNPSWQDIIARVNPNLYTISIEHEGKPEDLWTSAMYGANNRVLRWIAGETGVQYVVHHTLVGHNEINPVDRPNCPGPNVQWDRIAADANGGLVPVDQPMDPNVDGGARAAQTAAIANKPWMPINDGSALYNFALQSNLGYPQTDEFEFTVGGDTYVGQVYNLGIVYVKKGDWGNCKSVKKP